MAGTDTISGNLLIQGQLNPQGGIVQPANSIFDASVSTGANINQSKLQHQHRVSMAQDAGTATTNETKVVFTCIALTGATVLSISAGCTAIAVTPDTATVDLKVNGTTILSSVITLNASSTILAPQSGTIASPTLTQGQTLEVVIIANHSSGTLPQGVFVEIRVAEASQ